MRIRETYTRDDFAGNNPCVKMYQLEPGVYHYTILLALEMVNVPAPTASEDGTPISIQIGEAGHTVNGPSVTFPEYPYPRGISNLSSSSSGVVEVLAGPKGLVLTANASFSFGQTKAFTLELNAFLTKLG